ncbi:MAG: hypothetical protein XD87_0474 [candidate division WS6 bacterium 36_33]|uniref:Fibronectin type-III domain-containing protein n=1 Tax=candidate division WS6 bacterium 36_33 TaxID=1641388 RepID=A0A117LTL7_9BACT|nr:MAG: hypothetical protein XD87_0474 [candidate division WS6 bacterium 36_33]
MKSPRNLKKCPIFFLGLLLFFSAIGITTLLGIREFKKQSIKPKEVIVANITSTQGEIYWKTQEDEDYTVIYTSNSSDTVETPLDAILITKDSTTGEYIYSANIEDLNPDTEYSFNIKTKRFSWNQTSSFKTKDDKEALQLPELLKGDTEPGQLVLLKTDTGNYIKDTQEHGTWLIERPTEDYSLLTYATYSLKDNTKTENSAIFSLKPSPALAKNNLTTTNLNNITTLELKKGTSFIQIPIFLNNQSEQISSARELIEFSNYKILSIGLFRNDNWEEILINENGKIYGENFTPIPGEVYMFTTKADISLPIIEGSYSTELNIKNLRGWNLIPTSIFNYFPLTSKDILQGKDFSFISQTAIWNNNRSSFDYTIESSSLEIFGEIIPLSEEKGVFVKIPY